MNPTTEKTDPMLIHMVLDIRLLKSHKLPIIFEIEFLNFLTKFLAKFLCVKVNQKLPLSEHILKPPIYEFWNYFECLELCKNA